ncbi:MAG: thiamine phosphate synthase [Candidatus Omnitrophica bacterium]|nr:thiamine phosphate synthase [Candidatus Omnitrophota bacterium]MBU4590815.1 thiamine phosphate synthase [Candidatus Omnitrophota bacterium]
MKGYYFITDAGLSKNGNLSDVKSAIDAGVTIVQYRSKMGKTDSILEEAKALKEICKGKAIFIINDIVGVALSVDADGVHVGQGDMPYETARKLLGKDKIIGVTVHDLKEAMVAEKRGADYLGVSPVFSTTTKNDAGEACGVGLIREIRKNCKIPITAIGGITLDNVKEVIDTGVDAVCAISAVVTKDDVKGEIEKFQKLFR